MIAAIINNSENLYNGNLIHYFQKIFRENKGNNNSYHGIRHLLHVLWSVYDGIKFYQSTPHYNRFLNRALLIASLYHDALHLGRIGNDDINIELATRFLKKHALKQDLEDGTIGYTCLYIFSTEYNGGHTRPATTEYEKVLRDADISQVTSTAWLRIILFGLSAEIGITPEQMLREQDKFLSNIKFESEWGKAKFEPLIQERIQEARELVKILDTP